MTETWGDEMKIKGIIFDFDGTIADTLPICLHSFRRVFHEFDGRSLTDHEITAMFGPSEVGIIEQNLRRKEFVPQAIEAYYAHYRNEHHRFAAPDARIHELLGRLKSRGLKLGIYTGKARRSYEISCRHLNLDSFFDAAVTGDDVARPKPDPEGLVKALAWLQLRPDEAVYVGDSDADIEAGIRAGMGTIGVNWFKAAADAKFAVQPDHIVSDIEDFMKVMDSSFAP